MKSPIAASFSLKLISLSLFIFAANAGNANANSCEVRPFVSDGCSSPNQRDHETGASYVSCCFVHDLAYYKGGSEKSQGLSGFLGQWNETKAWLSFDNSKADEKFKQALGEIIAGEKYNGVKVGPVWAEYKKKEIAKINDINAIDFGGVTDRAKADIQLMLCVRNKIISKAGDRKDHATRTAIGILKGVRGAGDTNKDCSNDDDWTWAYGISSSNPKEACACKRSPNETTVDKINKNLASHPCGDPTKIIEITDQVKREKEIAKWIHKNLEPEKSCGDAGKFLKPVRIPPHTSVSTNSDDIGKNGKQKLLEELDRMQKPYQAAEKDVNQGNGKH